MDGVSLYGRHGLEHHSVPVGLAFPDKGGVIDELYEAVIREQEPLHNGRWGKATMEASLAVLESARTGRDIELKHQVPVID